MLRWYVGDDRVCDDSVDNSYRIGTGTSTDGAHTDGPDTDRANDHDHDRGRPGHG